jgi:hypothetical protein
MDLLTHCVSQDRLRSVKRFKSSSNFNDKIQTREDEVGFSLTGYDLSRTVIFVISVNGFRLREGPRQAC